ncbi:MAG TPA: tetratricopeptide repeat protein [Terriglobia bacterium]|jgi:tetratricopeptide (TPR) repeat protein
MLQKACLLAALTCLAGNVAYSQTTQTQPKRAEILTVHGRVITGDHNDPDLRIEVRLERATGQLASTTFADAGGNFEFRSLGPGRYYVLINLEGYEPVSQSIDAFSAVGDNSVTIFLSKPAVRGIDRPAGLDAADPDTVDISQMKDSLPKKAVQDYEKAIEEKQKGRTESAIRLLEEAIVLAPNFFHAHNNLGILYLSAKRHGDAEREFKSSGALNPKSELPLLNLGTLYLEEAAAQKEDPRAAGRVLDQALDALEQAVKLNPRSAKAYFILGQANYRSAFFEEAENAFKKSIAIDPKLWAGRLMLANVYARQERWPEVLEHLDAYLTHNPNAADRAHVEEMRAAIAKNVQATTK